MTFLPIVERELGAAARRPATHWMRFFAALATMAISLLLALSTPQSVPVPQLSKNLFTAIGLLAFGLHVLLKCFIAMRAVRRFSEDRLSGALELLLVTPLQPRDILSGQRQALRQSFRAASAWLVLLNVALIILIHRSADWEMGTSDRRIFTGIFLGGMLVLRADAWALSWIGMELGVCGKRQPRAVLVALGRVLMPNWLCAFLLVFVAQSGNGISDGGWAILITSWFLFGIVIDLVFGLFEKRRLQSCFREIASGPLSKQVKALWAGSTGAVSSGHRPLKATQP